MAAILNSTILNLAILDSAILVSPLKFTHTCQDWFPPFAEIKTSMSLPSPPLAKNNFTQCFWHNLMMAAILNSAMLDLDTLFSSLRFTQKHSHSTLTLTQINLIWLKFIHSHWTWWWWISWILPFSILPSWIQLLPCWIQTPCFSSLTFTQKHTYPTLTLIQTNSIWLKLIHSHLTRWWQSSWILLFCLQPS